eukprot:scpid57710/ scgid6735/ 
MSLFRSERELLCMQFKIHYSLFLQWRVATERSISRLALVRSWIGDDVQEIRFVSKFESSTRDASQFKDMIDDISFQTVDSNQDRHSLSFSLMCAAEMFVKNVVDWNEAQTPESLARWTWPPSFFSQPELIPQLGSAIFSFHQPPTWSPVCD